MYPFLPAQLLSVFLFPFIGRYYVVCFYNMYRDRIDLEQQNIADMPK